MWREEAMLRRNAYFVTNDPETGQVGHSEFSGLLSGLLETAFQNNILNISFIRELVDSLSLPQHATLQSKLRFRLVRILGDDGIYMIYVLVPLTAEEYSALGDLMTEIASRNGMKLNKLKTAMVNGYEYLKVSVDGGGHVPNALRTSWLKGESPPTDVHPFEKHRALASKVVLEVSRGMDSAFGERVIEAAFMVGATVPVARGRNSPEHSTFYFPYGSFLAPAPYGVEALEFCLYGPSKQMAVVHYAVRDKIRLDLINHAIHLTKQAPMPQFSREIVQAMRTSGITHRNKGKATKRRDGRMVVDALAASTNWFKKYVVINSRMEAAVSSKKELERMGIPTDPDLDYTNFHNVVVEKMVRESRGVRKLSFDTASGWGEALVEASRNYNGEQYLLDEFGWYARWHYKFLDPIHQLPGHELVPIWGLDKRTTDLMRYTGLSYKRQRGAFDARAFERLIAMDRKRPKFVDLDLLYERVSSSMMIGRQNAIIHTLILAGIEAGVAEAAATKIALLAPRVAFGKAMKYVSFGDNILSLLDRSFENLDRLVQVHGVDGHVKRMYQESLFMLVITQYAETGIFRPIEVIHTAEADFDIYTKLNVASIDAVSRAYSLLFPRGDVLRVED
jgi:hypothetical protein